MMKTTLSCSTELSRVLCLLGALVVASGVAGCAGDECSTAGEIRCVGNRAETCVWAYPDSGREGLIWYSDGCGEGEYCRPLKDPTYYRPICALTPDPDPRCAGADHLRLCDGNVVNVCLRGYVTATTDCTTGSFTGTSEYESVPSTGYCESSEDQAVCAMDAIPNPLCGTLTGGSGTVCDGNKLLACAFGYATSEVECRSLTTCVSGPPAFCSVTTIRYPGCSQSESLDFACKDDHVATCNFGYVQVEEVCPTGKTCQIDQYSHTPVCLPQHQ